MKNSGKLWKAVALVLSVAGSQIAAPAAEKIVAFSVTKAANQSSGRLISSSDHKRLDKGHVVLFSDKQPNGHKWVTARIHIKASPQVVWDTVHEERKSDPDLAYSKILEEGKGSSVIEQKFVLLPVIGTSVCVMKNQEIPRERIDYSLIKSDRFKAMEGSWALMPGKDSSTTVLELSSYVDLGMPIPRSWLDGITAKKLEKRLGNVRRHAEAIQANAVATKSDPLN